MHKILLLHKQRKTLSFHHRIFAQRGVPMYVNSGYLNNSRLDFKDKTRPLIVGSCGTYHLYTRPRLSTWRPRGRLDYQLIYIASGRAYFYFEKDKPPQAVPAGYMVLFRPREEQHYEYFGTDQTEVFWVHFTGSHVRQILHQYHFPEKEHVIYCGLSLDYRWIFRQMIRELQLTKPNYQDLLVHLLYHIFLLINRQKASGTRENTYMLEETEAALRYFHENYHTAISIEEYARSIHVSVSWFIQKFKEHTGTSPMQYILTLRITNAQYLLETSSYSVKEIAEIVGYDNPLYFSRLFKKQLGVSPREYRRTQMQAEDTT